jgi:aspartyl-tRNA(Asn)/glutamyl-tRNA(Gln) amidotransferase subunit A
VSRFGLVAYASSLDSVGVCADTVERARQVFRVIRGKDALDQTSQQVDGKEVNGKVIGVLKADELSPAVRQGFDKAKEGFRQLGYTLVEVDFPSLKYAVPAYYTIATAEASANLARYDGIRYGQRPVFAENPDDLVDKTRDAGFGPEVKLRILLGTFVLRSGFQDRYYLRAQRIRAGIRQQFEAVLRDKCAAILMPVFPTQAFRHGDAAMTPLQQKVADVYTCCANLAGLPALSFQGAVEPDEDWTRLPVGVQLLGPAFGEEALCDIAARYEAAHPFEHPEGWKAWWE